MAEHSLMHLFVHELRSNIVQQAHLS